MAAPRTIDFGKEKTFSGKVPFKSSTLITLVFKVKLALLQYIQLGRRYAVSPNIFSFLLKACGRLYIDWNYRILQIMAVFAC